MSDYHDRLYNYDSEALRKQIEDSNLFALDKEKEANAYARERYKMIDNLAKYLFALNESENINFGVEIMELADRCIKFYDPTAGTPFLAYFLSSWRAEYKRIKGKELKEQALNGVHVNKKIMDGILKHVRYAKSIGRNYQTEDFIQFISDELERSIDEIREYIVLISNGVTSNEIEDEEGDRTDLFTLVSENNNIDDNLEEEDAIEKWIDILENEFLNLQERQKPLISDLVTLKILDSEYINEKMIARFANKLFFSNRIFTRIIKEEKITARIVAGEYGITEQSASRSLKEYIKRARAKEDK